MPQVIVPVPNRTYAITADVSGKFLEFGPGSTTTSIATFVIQFDPDEESDYSAVVVGRPQGVAAQRMDAPFMPIPYRRCTVNNVASDYAIVSDTITGPSMIQVPANWSVGLLVTATVGSCRVFSFDLSGNSNP